MILEWLTLFFFMFPSWPVMLTWSGVFFALTTVVWCILVGRPVVLYLDGAVPAAVTAAWVTAIYAWITLNPLIPAAARVSPVRVALFFMGVALVHFLRGPIRELARYVWERRRSNYREY